MAKQVVKYYLDNGDDFQGVVDRPIRELFKELKKLGYKRYYSGFCEWDGITTLVGINDKNKVGLEEREKNGLASAYEGKL